MKRSFFIFALYRKTLSSVKSFVCVIFFFIKTKHFCGQLITKQQYEHSQAILSASAKCVYFQAVKEYVKKKSQSVYKGSTTKSTQLLQARCPVIGNTYTALGEFALLVDKL